MQIKGFFQKILFRNHKTGYAVFTIRDNDTYTTCAGFIPDVAFYTPLVLMGEYSMDQKHPETFVLSEPAKLSKEDNQMMMFIVNGLSEKIRLEDAEKIVSIVDSIAIQKNDETEPGLPNLFFVVKKAENENAFTEKFPEAITKKYKKELVDIYNKITVILKSDELFDDIVDAGGCYSDAEKLKELYGTSGATEKIKENPYNVGLYLDWDFRIADVLAQKYDFDPCCEERAKGILYYSMRRISDNGNTYASFEMLRDQIEFLTENSELGKIPEEYVLSYIVTSKKFQIVYKNDKAMIYDRNIYDAEQRILSNATRLYTCSSPLKYKEDVAEAIQRDCGMLLSEPQKRSFNAFRSTGIKIITGGPGCGKTTTINLLICFCEQCYPEKRICLCAPTGCAAQKMSEKSNKQSRTIHFLLGMRPFSGEIDIAYNSLNRLPYQIYILDEVSMADIELMSRFLDAVPNEAIVILVGDSDQLPSVGPGNVLNDFIKSGMFETYVLDTVFRQKDATGNIITNAKKINAGLCDFNTGNDFQIMEEDTEDAVLKKCLDYLREDKRDYQVLCPVKRHALGTFNLNHILQRINRSENTPFKVYGDTYFYEGDKVIAVLNNRDKGYFNGEPGIVESIDEEGILIHFANGDETYIRNSHLDEIVPAHALTVHKSQGSEYQEVVLVLSKYAQQMITKKILYTAITRAKETVTIFSEQGCMDSIRPDRERKTALSDRLFEVMCG